ncbi:MAG: fused MFS/spermidine synthase [Legionella sp.]|nr:fused MFS/spermidine synthase [Legionella sp.]
MWKTKLGTCIYTSPSGIKVYQNLFYRWLTFGNDTLQTVLNRFFPHQPVLYYLPALALMAISSPKRCCILGLGGGGLIHMLSAYYPFSSLIAVEIEKEVIQVAKDYFMIDSLQNISIVNEDALEFVRKATKQYDHLLIDLYNATHYPANCSTDEFFIYCAKILNPDGYIAINLANSMDQWLIFQLVKQRFNSTVVIPIKKSANLVIIASNIDTLAFSEKVLKHPRFKKVEWRQGWGYIANL